MLAALVGRSISRARGLLVGIATLLCGFQFLIVIIAREIQQSLAFPSIMAFMPAVLQQMSGGLFFGSFSGLASYGFIHPIVVLVLVEAAVFLASEPAGEVEAGIVDLTMARPVPRGMVVARTLLVVVGGTAAILLLMVTATRLALSAFTPAGAAGPPLGTSVLLAVNLMAVSWWFGSLSLLVASVARRRSTVLGVAGLVAIFLYLLNLIADIWSKARGFRFVTPFHYYNASAFIRGSNGGWPGDIAVLLSASIVLCAVASQLYAHRDL